MFLVLGNEWETGPCRTILQAGLAIGVPALIACGLFKDGPRDRISSPAPSSPLREPLLAPDVTHDVPPGALGDSQGDAEGHSCPPDTQQQAADERKEDVATAVATPRDPDAVVGSSGTSRPAGRQVS